MTLVELPVADSGDGDAVRRKLEPKRVVVCTRELRSRELTSVVVVARGSTERWVWLCCNPEVVRARQASAQAIGSRPHIRVVRAIRAIRYTRVIRCTRVIRYLRYKRTNLGVIIRYLRYRRTNLGVILEVAVPQRRRFRLKFVPHRVADAEPVGCEGVTPHLEHPAEGFVRL